MALRLILGFSAAETQKQIPAMWIVKKDNFRKRYHGDEKKTEHNFLGCRNLLKRCGDEFLRADDDPEVVKRHVSYERSTASVPTAL